MRASLELQSAALLSSMAATTGFAAAAFTREVVAGMAAGLRFGRAIAHAGWG